MGVNLCWFNKKPNASGSKTSTKVFITKINKNRNLIKFPVHNQIRRSNSLVKEKDKKLYEKERLTSSDQEESKYIESTKEATTQRSKFNKLYNYTNQTETYEEFDDLTIIEDRSNSIKIKSITVYFDYYIYALEITYIDINNKEFKSIHWANKDYSSRQNLEKSTLKLK